LNESIKRLEEKIAFLERHVTEQDKAMLELAEELAGLRREIKTLRDRTAAGSRGSNPDDDTPDERPPHY
jgi:SlyX protein